MMFAIKAEVSELRAETYAFNAHKTMYGGRHIAKGDIIFVFASENEGGPGLIASGVVTSSKTIAKKRGIARQTPRVSITIRRTALAKRRLGRNELKLFSDWNDGRAETELNFKFYRQARTRLPASRMKRRRSSADSFNCGRWLVSHSDRELVEFSRNQAIKRIATGLKTSSCMTKASNRISPSFSAAICLSCLVRPMKACLAILAMLLFANSARCADADRKRPDEESLRSYMAGEYDLIGRKADSTATYSGHVTLQDVNGVLQVTRTIEGKTDECVARFDTVAGDDKIPVLRIHFYF